MEAGRDLDIQIAEAMGCSPEYVDGASSPYCMCPDKASGFPPHGDYGTRNIHRYSTDIAAAWTVVEWMGSQNFVVSVEQWRHESVMVDVKLAVPIKGGDDFEVEDVVDSVQAPTAALAICRAALAAVAPTPARR